MVLTFIALCNTTHVQNGKEPSNYHYKHASKGELKFYNQVRYMDKLVGDIVNTIKDEGILDNTIIIYSSDNGTTSSAKAKGVGTVYIFRLL